MKQFSNIGKVFFLFPLLSCLFSSCGGDNLDAIFEMEYPNQRFFIQAGLNTIESHFFIIESIPTNQSFFFGNFTEEDVVEIAPTFATVSVNGGNGDFSFVDAMSILICEDSDVTESNIFDKCRREIFFREDIPLNVGRRVDLLPNTVNLKSYLTQDEFTVAFVLQRLRGFSNVPINTRLDISFEARR